MSRARRIAALAALVFVSIDAEAQKPLTMVDSYRKAYEVIDAAIKAHGGADTLRSAARHVRIVADGWDFHRTQGRRLGAPYDSTFARSDLMMDLSRNRLVRQRWRGWPGGFAYLDHYASDSAKHFLIEPRNHRYAVQLFPLADQQTGNHFLFPPWYVLAAYDAPAGQRRYLGRMRLPSGAEVDAVHFPVPPSGAAVIGFDPRTHLLRATMGTSADMFVGEVEVTTEYLDWERRPDGLMLPGRSLHYRAGEVASRTRFTTTLGYAIPDSLLAPPPSFTLMTRDPVVPVRELSRGVWLVGSGAKSLVMDFSDHLVVVDAPSNGSAEVIETVKTLAPGKPIRYVVPTHHHDDHFVGVRYHVANGATVVTTAGNTDYLRRILAAPMSTLMLARNQVGPTTQYKSETISGGMRAFAEGSRRLEIHQIVTSHAQETLVAWLPAEGILFQADLIEAPASGAVLRGANAETTMQLAEAIRQKGWSVKTFLGAHGSVQTPEQFRELVGLGVIPASPTYGLQSRP